MTRSSMIYCEAAELIDQGPAGFERMQEKFCSVGSETSADISAGACLAIDVVADEWHSPERVLFEKVFRPEDAFNGYWFGSLQSITHRDERVLALLFMAQAQADL